MSHKPSSISPEDRELFRKTVGEVKSVKSTQRPLKSTKEKRISIPGKPKTPTGAESWLTYLAPEDWLDTDDPLHFAKTGIQYKTLQRLKRGQFPIEATLDLHRQTLNEALASIDRFIDRCLQQQKRCICIIHGKGRATATKPVLKNFLNQYLRQHSAVLAFQSTLPKHGGTGAVYVLLKSF